MNIKVKQSYLGLAITRMFCKEVLCELCFTDVQYIVINLDFVLVTYLLN